MTQRKQLSRETLSPVDQSDSTFFTQEYSANRTVMLSSIPPRTYRSSTPPYFAP